MTEEFDLGLYIESLNRNDPRRFALQACLDLGVPAGAVEAAVRHRMRRGQQRANMGGFANRQVEQRFERLAAQQAAVDAAMSGNLQMMRGVAPPGPILRAPGSMPMQLTENGRPWRPAPRPRCWGPWIVAAKLVGFVGACAGWWIFCRWV